MSLTHRHGDDLRLTHECLPPQGAWWARVRKRLRTDQAAASWRARCQIWSNISSVSLPVKVFCWLG
jgi:hypothetical protein